MTDRETDETCLCWLAARRAGRSSYDIAKHYNVTPERVRTATNRVRADDIAAEPEAASFWGRA